MKQKLTKFIHSGIRFDISQDKLLVTGDIKALTDEDKQFLKTNKEAIIALVEKQAQELPVVQKVNTGVVKPLSFSQQSLWLLDKINNGSQHYNVISTFKLKGKVDYKVLNQTFFTILQRHESLRSCFSVNASGNPVQTVQPVSDFKVVVEELDPSLPDYMSQVIQKIEEEAHQVFDLTKDLLLSVRLLKLTGEEHILIVTMHHIASDGWSMGILISEFSVLYNSYLEGGVNPLPELSLQYSDYAYWQRQWLTGKVLENHKTYWKNQLANLPLLHNLPLDKPRPNAQSFNGSVHRSHIDKSLLTSLSALCHSESASLFMGIHAAFSSLLSRYSNETDIVIGSPVANRELAETADMVGFFMNLLVLRSDLSQKPNFRELIRQSKKVLEGAYEYQQMPFEKLIKTLNKKRSLSHSPLFQILLTLHNNQREEFALPELVIEPADFIDGKSARYDLSLDITETSEGLQLAWEYNTGLFKASTIIRIADNFNTLLTSLLTHPDENVFKVNMIGEKEATEIYSSLRGESVAVSAKDSAFSSFEKQVTNRANEVAVICDDVTYSYGQLGKKVDAIAHTLSAQGIQSGDRVGICLLRNETLVATIFACFKLGATYIPFDPVYPVERIRQIIEDVQPKCIVTLNPLETRYLKTITSGDFIYLDHLQYQDKSKATTSNYSEARVAYIIFTSGSTGRPKGIEVTHGNLTNLLKGFDISFGSEAQQRWLAQTSINFDISVLELIWTISRGHTIVLQQTNPFKLLAPERLKLAKKIDFSIMFFGADTSTEQKYDLLLEAAKFADSNNFTAIWTPERHFGEFGGAFPSPSVLSSALSVLTENLQIRSGSVVLPLHDPIRVAEEWSLLDNLSKGRVGISIASGWQPDDFVLNNANYKDRHQEMREKITELKKLWKGEPIVRKNGIDKDFEVKIRPRPLQKELPLWITAAGNPETFRYAGQVGANILTHMLGQSVERLAENIAIYHQALKENGFKIEDKKVSLMLHTYIDKTEQVALDTSEKPFKEYLGSSIKLMEPLAQELGLDVHTQTEELIEIAYEKFSRENTLIGSPESCQKMLYTIQSIGVTEVACLVDFGVENEDVLAGLGKIVETKNLYKSYNSLVELLNVENQKTELDLIDEYQVTHVQMTPSQSKLTLDLYKQTQNRSLSSVQHWFIGGEALNLTVVKGVSDIVRCKVYNMYGPTETTVWSAWREVDPENICIGNPIINTDLLLLNEFEQPVPVGVVGELYIGGAGVAKGYCNNTELTDKNFRYTDHPYLGNSRFYKTGDLMKLNADSTFDYVSRKDNQVKVNGYRVELEDIEKAISRIPGVKNCKVAPIANNNITTLSAYVVKEDIVHGIYTDLPPEQQAKTFHFPDGSSIYHQSDRQLAMLYREIIEDSIYFKHGISVPENGLVLDVGANIGTFCIDVNRRQPNAVIIAFEPIPQIFSALKKNFEHRQIKGRVINYGVSNKKEKATFYYYPEMAGMSGRFADKDNIIDAVGQYMVNAQKLLSSDTGISSEEQKVIQSFYENKDSGNGLSEEMEQYLSTLYTTEKVECQLTTISDIIDELGIQTIDLLKVDVEKSECLVLDGIRPEHWPMIHQVALEVDGDNNLDIITDLLLKYGYELNVEELVMSDADTLRDENTYMLYATNHNYVAKKNDAVVGRFQAKLSENAIREFLKPTLPDYMHPKDIAFVPAIPLMENGKVDMTKLKEFKSQESTPIKVAKLTNKIELAIYQMWCDVLKKENIPYHISIFEAGGNSIEIVLLHEKMQTGFKVNFSLIELFRNPTIAQQAKLVQSANGTVKVSVNKAMKKGVSRRNRLVNKVK